MRKRVVAGSVVVAAAFGALLFWLFPGDFALLSEGAAMGRREAMAGFVALMVLAFMFLGLEYWDGF